MNRKQVFLGAVLSIVVGAMVTRRDDLGGGRAGRA